MFKNYSIKKAKITVSACFIGTRFDESCPVPRCRYNHRCFYYMFLTLFYCISPCILNKSFRDLVFQVQQLSVGRCFFPFCLAVFLCPFASRIDELFVRAMAAPWRRHERRGGRRQLDHATAAAMRATRPPPARPPD
jgi:hypothetical protein